jgi:hypothetical protein
MISVRGARVGEHASGRRSSWASCVGGRDEHCGDAACLTTGRAVVEAAAVAWRFVRGHRAARCGANEGRLGRRFPGAFTRHARIAGPGLLLGELGAT